MTGHMGEQLLNPELSRVWTALGSDVPVGIFRVDLRSPRPGDTLGEKELQGRVVFDLETSRYVSTVDGMGEVGRCLDLGNAIVAVQESFAVLAREIIAHHGLDEEFTRAREEAAADRARRMAGQS